MLWTGQQRERYQAISRRESAIQPARGLLHIYPVIFAELALKPDTQRELKHRLSGFTCLDLPPNAALQAGRASGKYRRADGMKARPLPDFFIGAHTCVAHIPLLTRDPRRVCAFFPSVRLITP